MNFLKFCTGFILIIVFTSCVQKNKTELFKERSPSETNVNFNNTVPVDDSLSVLDFEYRYNGGGVALLDINNDGLQDIVFTGNLVPCRLYLNKGHFKFEDITEQSGFKTSGWCNGVSVVDINQDGYPDLYISRAGPRNTPETMMKNLFFINNKNNTFTEKAAEMNLNDAGYDEQAAFLDYDHDGKLDMYLVRNGFVNYNRNTAREILKHGEAPSTGKLFKNNGNLKFTDVSNQAGITTQGFGLGVSICDLNNDGWPDIYVSNDFLTSDLLYINQKNGTFLNQATKNLHHESYNGMGNDVADFNNDGLEDIVVADMLPPDNKHWKRTIIGNTYDQFKNDLMYGFDPQYIRNTLQLNNGDQTFSEIGQLAGIAATDWSWAPLFADFDNDGWKDLYVSNGYRQDVTDLDFIHYGAMALTMGTPEASRQERISLLNKVDGIKIHNFIFKNNRNLTFTDQSLAWGLSQPHYSNGAVYGDLDNDGDLDLVVNNIDAPASVYENKCNEINPKQASLRFKFIGPDGNRDGLGTKVYLWQHGQLQYNYFSPYRGYLSTVEPFVHFGIDNKPVDSVKVIWPDGKAEFLKNIKPNQVLKINYRSASGFKKQLVKTALPLFAEVREPGLSFKHEEDDFVDFKSQPLLPHLLSHEGPGIAVGDINGDHLDDFFIGGAKYSRGTVFIQSKNGRFSPQKLYHDLSQNTADDMGALLFDANNDGFNDLYVAKGGVSESPQGAPEYRHLLYLNDGKGNFSAVKEALPELNFSASSVVAFDYDHDGDLDLFVGGRVMPGAYPLSPRSVLLRNDSENKHLKFTDVSRQSGLPPEMGMVTDALSTDFDNDGWNDLIVTGEYMPIRFFKNINGKFTEITQKTGLKETNGWWNSLVAGDFDNDGDMDYMAGNLGLNSNLTASSIQPVSVYAKDYDGNGRIDPVMTHFVDGKEYITHSRDDINKQINSMRMRFKTYADYAGKTFQESFLEDEIKSAYHLKAQTFASAWVENLGKGKFRLHQLPVEAQFAPIYAMMCKDFNNDGNLDVLCVGNSFATEVNQGRYDAQGGLLLLNDGKKHFSADRKSFNISGDNKSLSLINLAHQQSLLLVGTNSDLLKVFKNHAPSSKVISINPDEVYAIITLKTGKVRKQEFYYGSSYLSQSSRGLPWESCFKKAAIYNIKGLKREVAAP